MEQLVYQEIAEALSKEMTKPNPVEKYRTEYSTSFSVPNFIPHMDYIQRDMEVHVPIL
jgi:hypothetical protein